MARFIFKLEGVLRHRKQIERQKQRDMAVAQAVARQIEQELRSLNDSMRATTDQLRGEHLIGKLDMAFLAGNRRYVAAMQRKGQGLVQKLANQERVVDAARQLLAEAAKQRKAIEKLKERRWQQWRAEQESREAIQLDEISQQMAFAQQMEEDESALNDEAGV